MNPICKNQIQGNTYQNLSYNSVALKLETSIIKLFQQNSDIRDKHITSLYILGVNF